MKYFVFVLGIFLVAAGGQAVWNGYDIIQVERGWSSVIAGSAAVAGGVVTIAIGFLMWRVDALRKAVLSLRELPVAAASAVAGAPMEAPEPRLALAGAAAQAAERAAEAAAAAVALALDAPPEVAAPPVAAIAPEVVPPPVAPAANNIASLTPRIDRVVVRGAPRVVPAAPLALSPVEDGSRPPGKRPEPADLAQRLRRVPLTKQQAIAHARNPELADVIGEQLKPSKAPPRTPGLAPGVWPERPSALAAKRSIEPITPIPVVDIAARPKAEAPGRSPAATHEWLERALSGGDAEPASREAQSPQASGLAAAAKALSVEPDIVATEPVEPAAEPAAPTAEAGSDDAPTPDDFEARQSELVAVTEPNPMEPVARYEARGTTYAMFADGSIEAETGTGRFRFASMGELRRFIEERQH